MKLTKSQLKQIIKEELVACQRGPLDIREDHDLDTEEPHWEAYKRVLAKIRKESKGLSNHDSYEFLMLLKDWTDRAVQ